jgi:hypothetical protein
MPPGSLGYDFDGLLEGDLPKDNSWQNVLE